MFSDRSLEEIAELERQTRGTPQLRAAQRALADDVTALVHGPAERDAAVQAADASSAAPISANCRSRCSMTSLPRLAARNWRPTVICRRWWMLAAGGVVPSKSAARRAITEGGAYVNNQRVTDPEARLAEYDLLHGRYVIVRRGKRTVGAVSIRRS